MFIPDSRLLKFSKLLINIRLSFNQTFFTESFFWKDSTNFFLNRISTHCADTLHSGNLGLRHNDLKKQNYVVECWGNCTNASRPGAKIWKEHILDNYQNIFLNLLWNMPIFTISKKYSCRGNYIRKYGMWNGNKWGELRKMFSGNRRPRRA